MLYVVLCDITALRTESAERLAGVFGLSELMAEKRNPRELKRSLGGYLTLAASYEEICKRLGKPSRLPPLTKDLLGKPGFKEKGALPAFSISHTGELAAVALSSEACSLGIDVEEEREVKNMEKIESRLGVDVNKGLHTIEKEQVQYLFASMREDGGIDTFSPVPDVILDYGDIKKGQKRENGEQQRRDGFFRSWTLTEALLKADGGGFCSIRRTEEIAECAGCLSIAFPFLGKKIYLSLARI